MIDSPGRVLLVEDHPLLGPAMVQSLAMSGFEVTIARSYEAAVSLLEAGIKPALLLTDIKIPGSANGLGLARWARERFPDMGILLQSGFVDGSTGGFAVLLKPFSTEMLLRAIREAWPATATNAD